MAKSNNKSNSGSIASGGSAFKPSGFCPCKTSNKAESAFVHNCVWVVRLSLINSNTLLKPTLTI